MINKKKSYENVLIIGGGDYQQAEHILQHYKNVENITIIDHDPRVGEVVNQYFGLSAELNLAISEQKVRLCHKSGDRFVLDCVQKCLLFDAVIIDSVNYQFEEHSPQPLFNLDCLMNLRQIMAPNALMCMRLGSQ